MTLLAMLDFFERHGISPDQEMGETVASLKYLIRRRFNAMVAIMRSIEKEQTLPTVGMMQALFNRELESDGEWEGDFDFFEQQFIGQRLGGPCFFEPGMGDTHRYSPYSCACVNPTPRWYAIRPGAARYNHVVEEAVQSKVPVDSKIRRAASAALREVRYRQPLDRYLDPCVSDKKRRLLHRLAET